MTSTTAPTTKTCRRCNETKSLDTFGADRRNTDGRRSYCKPCQAADRRKRYHSDPERELSRQRERMADPAVRERRRAYDASRAERHRELHWASEARRRMRDYSIEGRRVDHITRADIVARYGDRCIYCGGDFEQIDHILAIRAGGEHVLDNVAPACETCNGRKRDLIDWPLIRVFDAS